MSIIMRRGNDLRVLVNNVDQDGVPFDVTQANEIQWALAASVDDRENILLEKTLTAADIVITNDYGFYFDITGVESDSLTADTYYHEAVLTTADLYVYRIIGEDATIQDALINGTQI